MSIALSDSEVACLKKLAERFEGGEASWGSNGMEQMGLTAENYTPVLSMLERCGYIKNAVHNTVCRYSVFTIDASAVQMARVLAEEEKKKQEDKDIVEHVKVTLRKHPVGGWLVVFLIAATGLITAANQLLSLLKNLNLIK